MPYLYFKCPLILSLIKPSCSIGRPGPLKFNENKVNKIMEVKLNSSIQLNKELIAQQISHQEHLRGVSFKSKNMKYQSIKNENKLKNIQSPFGDFPKTHLKGIVQNERSKQRMSRKPLYELSAAKSNGVELGLKGSKLGKWFCTGFLDFAFFGWKSFIFCMKLDLVLGCLPSPRIDATYIAREKFGFGLN